MKRQIATRLGVAHVRDTIGQFVDGSIDAIFATPDYFLGRENGQQHLIGLIDDCSRMQTGMGLYSRECLESYIHLFYGAFTRFGLPLKIYVDKASFFNSGNGNATVLERKLNFFDVSFILANSPEAKGKIECVHQVWQDRLPRSFAHEGFGPDTPLEILNAHAHALVDYRNGFEIHREIGKTPQSAWDGAIAEGRNKLRPIPSDGWWELVWSMRKGVVIGPRGKILVDGQWCPTACPNGTRAFLYRHIDGTISIAINKPSHAEFPKVVFTTNPRIHLPGR